jgi:hypothetical protein
LFLPGGSVLSFLEKESSTFVYKHLEDIKHLEPIVSIIAKSNCLLTFGLDMLLKIWSYGDDI